MPSSSPVGQQFTRAAGVVVPLFALRGAHDMGTGDMLDLLPFIDWLADADQRVVQLLPINETAPGDTSPYNALSAFAIDPTYVSVRHVVDVAQSAAAQRWLRRRDTQEELRRLGAAAHREHHTAWRIKLRLLEWGFKAFEAQAAPTRREAFTRFCDRNVWWLDDYTLYRALREQQGWAGWEAWPARLRGRDAPAVAQAAAALAGRRRFLSYVQWVAAEQWAEVRRHAQYRGVLLKGDLPFVCARDSADVWTHRDLFDLSSSAGTPPDAFSATGQAWGLPLYDWPAMQRSDFRWWRQRARHARELYDLFRVDHVVGLYRTYAIPVRPGGTVGFTPDDEAAQLAQGNHLLRALLDEAGATVGIIAEDLGTVPDWVRESLNGLRIPGYKVFRWEWHAGAFVDPRTYPTLSVATSGTHDTDTLAAWWQSLGIEDRAAVLRGIGSEVAPHADPQAAWPSVHRALLERLYDAASALTILPIQDLFGWHDRINTPATIDEANWTYRLPVTAEGLGRDPDIAARMQEIREWTARTGRADRPPHTIGA